jgi:hypothetical protein
VRRCWDHVRAAGAAQSSCSRVRAAVMICRPVSDSGGLVHTLRNVLLPDLRRTLADRLFPWSPHPRALDLILQYRTPRPSAPRVDPHHCGTTRRHPGSGFSEYSCASREGAGLGARPGQPREPPYLWLCAHTIGQDGLSGVVTAAPADVGQAPPGTEGHELWMSGSTGSPSARTHPEATTRRPPATPPRRAERRTSVQGQVGAPRPPAGTRRCLHGPRYPDSGPEHRRRTGTDRSGGPFRCAVSARIVALPGAG